MPNEPRDPFPSCIVVFIVPSFLSFSFSLVRLCTLVPWYVSETIKRIFDFKRCFVRIPPLFLSLVRAELSIKADQPILPEKYIRYVQIAPFSPLAL